MTRKIKMYKWTRMHLYLGSSLHCLHNPLSMIYPALGLTDLGLHKSCTLSNELVGLDQVCRIIRGWEATLENAAPFAPNLALLTRIRLLIFLLLSEKIRKGQGRALQVQLTREPSLDFLLTELEYAALVELRVMWCINAMARAAIKLRWEVQQLSVNEGGINKSSFYSLISLA